MLAGAVGARGSWHGCSQKPRPCLVASGCFCSERWEGCGRDGSWHKATFFLRWNSKVPAGTRFTGSPADHGWALPTRHLQTHTRVEEAGSAAIEVQVEGHKAQGGRRDA